MDARNSFEFFGNSFAYERIPVNREDNFRIRHGFHKAAERSVDVVHGVAQVFSSMRRHEDDSLVFFNGFDFRIFEW